MKRPKYIPEEVCDNSLWQSREKNARRKMVSKKEYLMWLIGFMNGRGIKEVSTEGTLYDDTLTEDNKEKISAVSELFSLIDEFCRMHNIKQDIHEVQISMFPHLEYIFECDGYYFSIFTMIGQGSITILTMLSKEEAEELCDFFIAINDILK